MLDQEVQNYMSIQKINKKFIWGVNLLLFAGLVFLGIEQAGRGAEISRLEGKIESATVAKRQLSEKIFKNSSEDKIVGNISGLGFDKPQRVIYLNTEDIALTLR